MTRSFAHVLAGAFALLPRRLLGELVRARLQRICGGRFSRIIFYTSGRSALHSIMTRLYTADPGARVLIPDYICNIVPRAVTGAGLACDVYRTDNSFQVDWCDLELKLADPTVRAIVLASIFGAQTTTHANVRRIRDARPDLYIVLDECQNLTLATRVHLDDRTLLVFSFGPKTVYGAGGGAVAFMGDSLGLRQPTESWVERVQREKRYLRRYWRSDRHPLRGGNAPKLEFSRCEQPTYQLQAAPAGGFTLLTAYYGLGRLGTYEANRRRRYDAVRQQLARKTGKSIIETESIEISPYVPVLVDGDVVAHDLHKHPLKGPYALDTDPDCTLRPRLLSIVNDGRVAVNATSKRLPSGNVVHGESLEFPSRTR